MKPMITLNNLGQGGNMNKYELLSYELEGVIKDIEMHGLDDVCIKTIKRVRNELIKISEADEGGKKMDNHEYVSKKFHDARLKHPILEMALRHGDNHQLSEVDTLKLLVVHLLEIQDECFEEKLQEIMTSNKPMFNPGL